MEQLIIDLAQLLPLGRFVNGGISVEECLRMTFYWSYDAYGCYGLQSVVEGHSLAMRDVHYEPNSDYLHPRNRSMLFMSEECVKHYFDVVQIPEIRDEGLEKTRAILAAYYILEDKDGEGIEKADRLYAQDSSRPYRLKNAPDVCLKLRQIKLTNVYYLTNAWNYGYKSRIKWAVTLPWEFRDTNLPGGYVSGFPSFDPWRDIEDPCTEQECNSRLFEFLDYLIRELPKHKRIRTLPNMNLTCNAFDL